MLAELPPVSLAFSMAVNATKAPELMERLAAPRVKLKSPEATSVPVDRRAVNPHEQFPCLGVAGMTQPVQETLGGARRLLRGLAHGDGRPDRIS